MDRGQALRDLLKEAEGVGSELASLLVVKGRHYGKEVRINSQLTASRESIFRVRYPHQAFLSNSISSNSVPA
ncbi:hypothetical protein GCM10009526_26160 [Glutamicibacter creatinolyticus]